MMFALSSVKIDIVRASTATLEDGTMKPIFLAELKFGVKGMTVEM
jgi:hypothetical protein